MPEKGRHWLKQLRFAMGLPSGGDEFEVRVLFPNHETIEAGGTARAGLIHDRDAIGAIFRRREEQGGIEGWKWKVTPTRVAAIVARLHFAKLFVAFLIDLDPFDNEKWIAGVSEALGETVDP